MNDKKALAVIVGGCVLSYAIIVTSCVVANVVATKAYKKSLKRDEAE